METTFEKKIFDEDEYFLMEESSIKKHLFINGKITIMSGGTITHNRIATNILTAIYNAIAEKDFVVLNSDTKIRVDKLNSFVYPDAVVIAEKPILYKDRLDIITNPLLVVEVISPSTAHYDTNMKFSYYKLIPSFKEYVMVNQFLPWVQTSIKIDENTWKDADTEGIENSVYLKAIDCYIDLHKIYKGIEFTKV
jgi:Uma2 family endonuclease